MARIRLWLEYLTTGLAALCQWFGAPRLSAAPCGWCSTSSAAAVCVIASCRGHSAHFAPGTFPLALLWTANAAEAVCRHILSALYNVADRYDEDAIRSVLQELTPCSARIMWASKTHEARCVPSATYTLLH